MTVSGIYRHGPSQPLTPEVEAERRQEAGEKAWHTHGLALIRPGDIHDDFERQTVVNVANRLYGRRQQE